MLDAIAEDGNTALHYCSLYGNKQLAKFLVLKGPQITVVNKNFETPISILKLKYK